MHESAGEVAVSKRCTNCESELVDVYCAKCGERQPHLHDLTMGHFSHEVVHELVHLDSKLFGTLRDLVVRPGKLTVDYFAGRKKRAISPLRLVLTLFAVQFLAYTLYKPAAVYSIEAVERFAPPLTSIVERHAAKRDVPMDTYRERTDQKWQKAMSFMQLLNIVGIALVLKVLYRRRYYVEHLVFSAHLLSFAYLVALAVFPIYAVIGYAPGTMLSIVSWTTNIVLIVYSFLALRRYYDGTTGKQVVKTALLHAGYTAVGIVLMTVALVYAMFIAQ